MTFSPYPVVMNRERGDFFGTLLHANSIQCFCSEFHVWIKRVKNKPFLVHHSHHYLISSQSITICDLDNHRD